MLGFNGYDLLAFLIWGIACVLIFIGVKGILIEIYCTIRFRIKSSSYRKKFSIRYNHAKNLSDYLDALIESSDAINDLSILIGIKHELNELIEFLDEAKQIKGYVDVEHLKCTLDRIIRETDYVS